MIITKTAGATFVRVALSVEFGNRSNDGNIKITTHVPTTTGNRAIMLRPYGTLNFPPHRVHRSDLAGPSVSLCNVEMQAA
jgi:hypothetical protein